MGTLLVVGVTKDEGVNKGPGRPITPEIDRVELVRGQGCVYQASLVANSIDALKQWKPQIYVKGADYMEKGLLPEEIEYCAANGIEIRFTKPSTVSTTKIIERIKCTFA